MDFLSFVMTSEVGMSYRIVAALILCVSWNSGSLK